MFVNLLGICFYLCTILGRNLILGLHLSFGLGLLTLYLGLGLLALNFGLATNNYENDNKNK